MPDFKNIQVSTKTVIAQTNASYDIQKLYEKLPVSDYIVVKKRRGRRKNTIVEDPNKDLPSGSIITLKYFDNVKGVVRKAKKKKGKFFRNAVSIVMKVMDKFVNSFLLFLTFLFFVEYVTKLYTQNELKTKNGISEFINLSYKLFAIDILP